MGSLLGGTGGSSGGSTGGSTGAGSRPGFRGRLQNAGGACYDHINDYGHNVKTMLPTLLLLVPGLACPVPFGPAAPLAGTAGNLPAEPELSVRARLERPSGASVATLHLSLRAPEGWAPAEDELAACSSSASPTAWSRSARPRAA